MKTKYLKITTAMLAALSVSACGGGGGPVAKVPPVEVPATYAGKMGSAIAIVETMLGDDVELNSVLPNGGSANYAGFMTVPDPSAETGSLVGDFNMRIDFMGLPNFFNGKADNFRNSLDEVWSGNLEMRTNNIIWVDTHERDHTIHTDGTLTSETGVETLYAAKTDTVIWAGDPNPSGDPYLANAPQYVAGDLYGTMETYGHVENFADEVFAVELTD